MNRLAKNIFKDISFRKKVILYTSMMLYVSILLLGLLIFNRAVETFSDMANQNASNRLTTLNEVLKSRLDSYDGIVSTLLLDWEFQKKLEQRPVINSEAVVYDNEIYDYLNNLCAGKTVLVEWMLYCVDDGMIAGKQNIHPLSEAANSDWYTALREKKINSIYWSLEKSFSESSSCVFSCATGVQNKKTRVVPAYFRMTFGVSCISDFVRAAAKDVDGVIYLCSGGGGDILWCTENDWSQYGGYVAVANETGSSGSFTINGESGERGITVLDGGKFNYRLICVRDTQVPVHQYISFSRYFLVVTFVVVIFSLVILLLSANLIGGRISVLTDKIRSMDENDLCYDGDTSGGDEAGELSRAFAGLLGRIRTLIEHDRQLEKERFELEIKALQSQINPHFLFNTLSVINLLAREIEADNISESIEALAAFYRLSLNNGEKLISVQDELRMLDCYLKICSIRYRGRLNLEKSIDPAALDCLIPKLVIQPFIENAVFHGFSPYSDREPTLNITVRREGEMLLFIISDNGEGMSPDELIKASSGGFAVTSVDKRIKLLYGDECGVFIESVPGCGTTVTVKLGILG